jgi:alkylhydroperoxidase family enzyme
MMQNPTRKSDNPLITPLAPAGEESRVDAVLDAVKQRLGFIPDGLRLFSLSPVLLESFVANIAYFNSGERLSPALMAMIRYLVSCEAKCKFCINMNEGFLANMGLDLDSIRTARRNPEAAPIPATEIPLLLIALKSASNPERVNQADIQSARTQGWTDRDIFDVVAQATSNRAFNSVLRTFNVETQGAFA